MAADQAKAAAQGIVGLVRAITLLLLLWFGHAAGAIAAERPLSELEAQLATASGRERLQLLTELVNRLRQDQPRRAIEFGQQALEMLAANPDPHTAVSLHNEMAWAEMVLGQHDQARALAEAGQALAQQTGDRAGEARAVNNLGAIARARGKPLEAIPLFERAAELYRQLGMQREAAGALNNLGVAHGFDLADYGTALDYMLQALDIRIALDDAQDLALSYNNIGVIYSRLGDHPRAIEHFQKALQIRRASGAKGRIAGTLHNLGDLYIDRKEWPQAMQFHREALQLREEIGDRPGMLISLIALGSIHTELDEFALAQTELDRAAALGAEIQSPRETMQAELALAELYRRRGKLDEAQRRAERAVEMAQSISALESTRQAYLELATVREQAREFAGALYAYKHYKEISDRIFDEDRTRRIELLESRYQAERREHEIESLRREQAVQDLTLSRRRFQRDVLAVGLVLLVATAFLLHRRRRDLERVNRQLAEMSVSDSLTGLRNRRYLHQQMQDEQALLRRQAPSSQPVERPFFLLIDVDHFKLINDRHGHAAGDQVLVQFADILRRSCRESDELVRWGGEEFLVLTRHGDGKGAALLAERIRQTVAGHDFEIGSHRRIRVSCSLGFAAFPLDVAEPQRWSWEQSVAIADAALYAAKEHGRNAWAGVIAIDGPQLPSGAHSALPEATVLARHDAVHWLHSWTAPAAAGAP